MLRSILLLSLALLWFLGCGSDSKTDPPVRNDPPQTHEEWSGVQQILQDNCALSGCHANSAFTKEERAFFASAAVKRISNGTMPPTFSPKYSEWTDGDKASVLAFYDKYK